MMQGHRFAMSSLAINLLSNMPKACPYIQAILTQPHFAERTGVLPTQALRDYKLYEFSSRQSPEIKKAKSCGLAF